MQALDVIAQTNALLAELLITEAGCDGVYYCVQGGEYDRFTPEEYRKIITPVICMSLNMRTDIPKTISYICAVGQETGTSWQSGRIIRQKW